MSSAEYGIAMPFVVVASKGGPYDDAAYCAGFEMGLLDARLDAMIVFDLAPPHATLRRSNLPQAELVAMQHDCMMAEIHHDEWTEQVRAEWAHVVFTRGTSFMDIDTVEGGDAHE